MKELLTSDINTHRHNRDILRGQNVVTQTLGNSTTPTEQRKLDQDQQLVLDRGSVRMGGKEIISATDDFNAVET